MPATSSPSDTDGRTIIPPLQPRSGHHDALDKSLLEDVWEEKGPEDFTVYETSAVNQTQ